MKKIYEFENNMEDLTNEVYDDDYDEWGCAFLWDETGNHGVEYNLCVEHCETEEEDKEYGYNDSAIYYTEMNQKTGYMETDYSLYEHYEIDFDDKDWEEKLRTKMKEVLENMLNKKRG